MSPKTDTINSESPARPTLLARIIEEVKFLVGLFAFITVFFTLVWGHYKIPTESMQPTLEVGDHLYVSKFAYGYSRHSLPFGLSKLPLPDGKIFARLPKRGDVVVFAHPHDGTIMIKRAVGLPGDRIVMRGGRLILNDQMIDRDPTASYLYREHKAPRSGPRGPVQKLWRFSPAAWPQGQVVGVGVYRETLPGQSEPHIIYERTDQGGLDNTVTFTVPENNIFFMGDNRDNSVDSRAPTGIGKGPGLVPAELLIGRADLMMFSFKRCPDEDGLFCPPKRFLKGL